MSTWPPPVKRAGLLARILRRPCPVCERHKSQPTPHVCQFCERPLDGHWWTCSYEAEQ